MLDVARATLAELDAGLITLAELRDERRRSIGSFEIETDVFGLDTAPDFVFDVESERTEFSGLALVTLTVTDDPLDGSEPVRVTLRQLAPLRDEAEREYEADDLVTDLPGVVP